MKETPDNLERPWQMRIFIVDSQGVATEVTPSSASVEARRMMEKWEEETSSKSIKDLIGRLLAITGLIIILISPLSDYMVVLGFALLLVGRVIIVLASYKPAKEIQGWTKAGLSIVEKVGHWF